VALAHDAPVALQGLPAAGAQSLAVQCDRDAAPRTRLQEQLAHGVQDLRLLGDSHELPVLHPPVGRQPPVPFAPLGAELDVLGDALGRDAPLQLGDRSEDVEHEPPDRTGGIDVVAQGDELDPVLGSLGLFGSSLVIWIFIVAADVALSITLYLLLEPVSCALSLVAAAFRLVYSAILGGVLLNLYSAFLLLTSPAQAAGPDVRQRMALSFIDTFSACFLLALVFFAVHVVTLGFLLYRSHTFRGRWASWSSPRASATAWTVWRACSCPSTAAW
jgi:hypothetical protein